MENNQLKFNNEKESSTHSKQKEIFQGLSDKRMEEIQDLSKQIDFNNFTYHCKGNTVPKTLIGFKGALNFYNSIMKSYITLEKAEEQQKELKLELNEIVK